MNKPVLLAVLLTLLAVPATFAQVTTNPIRYTWIASSCETWNCAAAALILSGGDKNVLVMPTSSADRPWVVLRRVEEGSLYIPDDEPFTCEVFTTMTTATSRFDSLDECQAPLMLSVPDGRAVVASIRGCSNGKKRAVRH